MNTTVVISRSFDSSGPETAKENALMECCAVLGVDILIVPHIYHLPDNSEVWSLLSDRAGQMVVVSWLHPRPIEFLLRKHGTTPHLALNLGAFDTAEACFEAIKASISASDAKAETLELTEPLSARWYPVVDLARCNNCGHCLQFCIFDVFTSDDSGAVVVQNPDNCKPGCPACSRVCPESAIMFPLYVKDEAIAGAPGKSVTPDPSAAKRMRPRVEMNKEAMDDIDLLINDLENLATRRSSS
jgi:NAD-dependent dihydropyrimidine dehydrogenase PreA subunit